MTKRLGPGFAARAGVCAAAFAADGLTATKQTLEGRAGLFALYQRGKVDIDALMDALGVAWCIPDYSFKPYPCCRANHTVIELGLKCHAERIAPDSVTAIEIGLGEYNWGAVGPKYEPARNDVVHAQFNAAYSFASALIHGKIDLSTYQQPGITEPEVTKLAAITNTRVDSRIPPKAVEPAYVRLTFSNGTTKELYSDAMKGGVRNPMSNSDLLAKFYSCLGAGLGASRGAADRLADCVFSLESSSDAAAALVAAFPAERDQPGILTAAPANSARRNGIRA